MLIWGFVGWKRDVLAAMIIQPMKVILHSDVVSPSENPVPVGLAIDGKLMVGTEKVGRTIVAIVAVYGRGRGLGLIPTQKIKRVNK